MSAPAPGQRHPAIATALSDNLAHPAKINLAMRQFQSSERAGAPCRLRAASLIAALLCVRLAALAQVDLAVHPAPDFGSGVVWLDQNAPAPHHISGYRGQVVLIDFWEYTCINCIRDFGVLKRWYAKYHPFGLQIVGVHYGEFNVGFKVENVREAVQRFALPWPVVADQEGSTWKAYNCSGWPTRFLIDQKGNIVMRVFGEGHDDELEAKIREVLAATHPDVSKAPSGQEPNDLRHECGVPTTETYLGEIHGASAVIDLAGHHQGEEGDFQPPHSPPDGKVTLVGRWRVEKDGATSDGHGAAAEVRYHARSLYSVLSLAGSKPVRVYLFEDGNPLPQAEAGSDVQFDAKGAYVEVTQPRMYYLVRSPAFTAHLLALQPEGSGLTVNTFTYGNNCQLEDKP